MEQVKYFTDKAKNAQFSYSHYYKSKMYGYFGEEQKSF